MTPHPNTVKSPHNIPCSVCGKFHRFNVRTGRTAKCVKVKAQKPFNYTLAKDEGANFKGEITAWKRGDFSYGQI